MENISRSQNRLSPEYSRMLFKRHLQGALVRSVASLIMGLFAIIAFYVGSIKSNHLTGVGFSILFLILINPPTLLILKKIKSRLVYRYFSLLINFLEIIGYTGIIYFLGGIEATYLTPIYAALITYVGTVSPRSLPFIVAALCALAFSSIVTLEYLGYLPHETVVSDFRIPLWDQMIRLSVVIGLLFLTAYISSSTANILKRTRNKLKRKNIELQVALSRMEDVGRELTKAHGELEKRIEERTKDLAEVNKELVAEISERKQAEEAMRESELQYRLHFENVTDVIYSIDPEFKAIDVSPSVEKILGYRPDEVIGLPFQELNILAPEYLTTALSDLKRVLAGEKITSSVYEFIAKDGSRKIGDVSGSPLIKQGKIIGAISVARDITEKRKLETQLQRAQRLEAIGTLAGGVAHDLNNILGGLVSYPELLLLQLPEDSPLRESILTMQKSGEKAAAVVQDLLTLARRGVVLTEVVNLDDVISDYLKSPEHEKLLSYHRGVYIETHFEKDILNILGSPAHLSKTIMNLVSNAVEAMPEGGKLTLSTENRHVDRPIRGYDNVKEGDYAVFTISDTGTGISPDDMGKIFEPFYTKKKMGKSGTGLGMAVVWGTVKDHNGYIDVQSTEGKGTTFTLYFPVTRKKVSEDKSHLAIESYSGHGESILIVDDMEEQRKIASGMLKKLGYSVVSVSSGEEAVEYLTTNKVDLLLLDMIMEAGMDGLETYKKIIELHPGQKALIASGFSETDRVKEVQSLGAGAYIRKPLLLEKMGLAVKEELKK